MRPRLRSHDQLARLIVVGLTHDAAERVVVDVLAEDTVVIDDVSNGPQLVPQLPEDFIAHPLAAGAVDKDLVHQHLVHGGTVEVAMGELVRMAERQRQVIAVVDEELQFTAEKSHAETRRSNRVMDAAR